MYCSGYIPLCEILRTVVPVRVVSSGLNHISRGIATQEEKSFPSKPDKLTALWIFLLLDTLAKGTTGYVIDFGNEAEYTKSLNLQRDVAIRQIKGRFET